MAIWADPNSVQNATPNATIQSALLDQIRDDLLVVYAGPVARAHRDAIQSVADSTYTGIAADNLIYDSHSCHTVVGGVSRFVVPANWAGEWEVGMYVNWQANGDNLRKIHVSVSGQTNQIVGDVKTMGWGGECEQTVHTSWQAVAGDYFEYWAYQDCGSALNLEPIGLSNQSIWARWVRGPHTTAA